MVARGTLLSWKKVIPFIILISRHKIAQKVLGVETDDYEIWQSFKSGSTDAFHKIYNIHFHLLFEYGTRLTQDRELVKDAVHDLFVKLWNNKDNLGDVINIRAYLLVALRSTVFNILAREKKVISSEINDAFSFEMVFSVENELIRKESEGIQAQTVIDGLNQLSPRQKEVLYLRFYQELSYEEVASIMDVSLKATYKLNARALKALKDALGTFIISNLFFVPIYFLLSLSFKNSLF